MSDLTILTMAMPHIHAEIERQKERVIAQAVADLRAEKLTPEGALHRWMEINALIGVGKTLITKLKNQTETAKNG